MDEWHCMSDEKRVIAYIIYGVEKFSTAGFGVL